MKNVTSLKATKTESPKTPGGISKSLLTPCRRLGLSRNWKNAGPSPFISPLTTGNSIATEPNIEKKETRKRKVRTLTEEIEESVEVTPTNSLEKEDSLGDVETDGCPISSTNRDEIVTTPLRHVEIPRRKKSKTLLSKSKSNVSHESVNIGKDSVTPILLLTPTSNESEIKETVQDKRDVIGDITEHVEDSAETEEVVKPLRKSNSKSNNRKTEVENVINKTEETPELNGSQQENVHYEIKKKSPNELTKECIVVIQKKIFKTDKNKNKTVQEKENKTLNVVKTKNRVSQTIFDSDSDDIPLCQINKDNKKPAPEIINLDEDDDFEETNAPVKKLVDKNTSTGGLKPSKKLSIKHKPRKEVHSKLVEANLSNSFEDDDFETDKRTILIRKTYDKVTKPQRAKSTGSITQRDVDELKARIETKKKMLMAKAMTEDTSELRTLIKKWQKGCQDALMELMELMKNKFPEKQSMDYAEMLQTLKIPANLVGYDEDNDCFTTPDDEGIILAKFKDL